MRRFASIAVSMGNNEGNTIKNLLCLYHRHDILNITLSVFGSSQIAQ